MCIVCRNPKIWKHVASWFKLYVQVNIVCVYIYGFVFLCPFYVLFLNIIHKRAQSKI